MPVASKSSLPRRKAGKPLPPPTAPARVAKPWSLRSSATLKILELDAFKKLPWLLHGFSTAPGGISDLDAQKILNLSFTEWDTRENVLDRKSTRLNSSHLVISYAVFCLKKKKVMTAFP